MMQAISQGQSARLILPKDGDQYRRLIPLRGTRLMQGKKILLFAPTSQHLEEINNILTENQLAGLSFTIKDTKEMQNQLQLSLAGDRAATRLNKSIWTAIEKNGRRLANLIDDQFHGLLHPSFGQHNRQNLIAAYVSAHQINSKAWLAGLIPAPDMAYTMERFNKMSQYLELAVKQYNGQLEHPLSQLHEQFYKLSTDAAETQLNEQLDLFLAEGKKLRLRFLSRIDQYQTSLQHHYDQHYFECATILRHLIHDIEDFEQASQQSISVAGGFAKRKSLFGLINGQQTDDARQSIIDRYEQLRILHAQTGEIDFHLPIADDIYQPNQLLNQYQVALIDWHQSVPVLIQEQLIRLNHKTVHPATQQDSTISELEDLLAEYVERLNHAKLFTESFSNNSLTILQQQQLLGQIIQQLQAIKSVLADFQAFSRWQSHWLACDATTQRIILQLVKVGAKDWLSIFESWFWYQSLLQLSSRDLPRNDKALQQLSETSNKLQQLIPDYLYNQQQSQWPSAKQAANLLTQKSVKASKQILELAQRCFPILLGTEAQLDQLLTSDFKTDCLLIFNAEFFSEKTIRPLARQHLLSSDVAPNNQMAGTNLWQEPGLGNINLFQLSVTTAAIPPSLRFYLASQFGTVEQHPTIAPQMELHPVMGRNDEADNSNEAEARQIIKYLYQLQTIEDGRPPHRLTVLCATENQKRRIQHYIREGIRRQVVGSDWLTVLQEKGLRILQFSEIKGQQHAKVIVSLVTNGIRPESMDWLLGPQNAPSVRALLSVATEHLVLFHSVSEDVRKEWLNSDHPMLVLIGQWLAYVRAVSKSVGSQQKQILQSVAATKSKERPPIPLIYRAVGQALLSYFPAERISFGHRVGPLFFPLIIWPETTNKTGVVIFIDHLTHQQALHPWLGGLRLKKAAKQHGFKIAETWSASWWQNPDQAARQLAGRVMRGAQISI